MCQADTPVTITKPAAEGPKKPAAAEGPEKPAAKASFRGLYRFADRRDAGLLVLGSLMVFISGANTPLQLVVFGRLLDSFNAADTSDVKERVHFYAMWYALLGVQQVITNSVQTSCFAAVAARQARQMRQAYFRALARRPMAFFDAQDAGALASSVMVKTTDVQNGLGDDLVKLAQQVRRPQSNPRPGAGARASLAARRATLPSLPRRSCPSCSGWAARATSRGSWRSSRWARSPSSAS